MKETLRRYALGLGFDVCRFTSADAPASGRHFEAWLKEGAQGTMAYLDRSREKRLDPRRVLDGARSVIVLAVSYHRPGHAAAGEVGAKGDQGWVARYACHGDYHEVLWPRLREFCQHLEALGGPGTRALGYTDTGPVLERDLAQRAGVGFVGKHTNLIGRRWGNWLLLAEVLTTLELEPDASEHNRCGSCVRCLEACPTGAIPQPFRLDARRCLAYLTIEFRGSIPEAMRPAMGNRVFGCDDCLAVCPWNRFAQEGRLMAEHRRYDLSAPRLVELLGLDEAGFRVRFGGTPLERTKLRGLQRNVCVALGNVGHTTALPALERCASGGETLVAEHAHWAMARIRMRLQLGPGN